MRHKQVVGIPNQTKMINLTIADAAYIAGLFDGEGTVGYYNASQSSKNRPGYFHASINITNTDPRPLVWIAEVTGIGKVSLLKMSDASGRRRPAYQWQVGKRHEVIAFLVAVRPYLKIKHDQVDILLTHFELEATYTKKHGSVTSEVVASRQKVADALKVLKRRAFLEGVETVQAEPYIN